MALDMYAGIYVRDYETAKAWYALLLGVEPSYVASATEAVWELAEHRSIAIEQDAGHAGHSIVTLFVDDFDARVAASAARGIDPAERFTYRKAIYRDPDGNKIGFGGGPA